MEQAHADRAREPLAAGPKTVGGSGNLQDVLEGLEEATLGDAGVEAAGTGQCLDDAPAGHAANKGLEGQRDDGWAAVAVEDVLATLELGPVDPVRDSMELGPELVEFGIARVVMLQEGV